MPLLVRDFTWTQTDSAVHVCVPLKGARAERVDVVCTEEYLKVHFPPHLFEAFLWEPVDHDRSSAKLGNGVAAFTLAKKTKRVWQQLTMAPGDKEQMKDIRQRALQKHQEKVSSEGRAKAERRQAHRKYTLQTMMQLEQEERESIQKMKDAEREKTSLELKQWQQRQKEGGGEEEGGKEEKEEKEGGGKEKERGKEVGEKAQSVRDEVNQRRRRTRGAPPLGSSRSETQRGVEHLPPLRCSGNIQVTFTPRVFPTALRESRMAEEEEWLQKQAAARRATVSDLQEDERNPDWLKDKGDARFAAGDYQGAVNAYSLAIRLNPKIPALFSNRAACHLKLKNLHRTIEDATQALQLLTPPVPANAVSRVRASVRRGSAFCQLQLYAEGLQDYLAALRIDPENQDLQRDVRTIRDVIQGSRDDTDTQQCNTDTGQ